MLVALGRFFMLFGLAMFLIGMPLTYILASTGTEVPEVVARAANIFRLAGAASILTFVGAFGAASFWLKDYLVKPGLFAFYTSMTVAAIPGIMWVVTTLLNHMPQQPVWQALSYTVAVVGPTSIIYYMFNRLGFLPDL